jgi:DNA-3-methyladenine glycosylase
MKPKKLPRSFYQQETVSVARGLIGTLLWRRIEGVFVAARIVETEAYLGANDPASHARGGLRSKRNEAMYGEGGHAYVYFTYGMHWCMNVVTQEAGIAEAVLLRAAEPVRGVELMRERRPKAKRDSDLMSGPGKLCMALAIDRALDGAPLDGSEMFITEPDATVAPADIVVSSRIGVGYAGDAAHWPLRFYLRGSEHVSRPR